MKFKIRPLERSDILFVIEQEKLIFGNIITEDEFLQSIDNPLLEYYILEQEIRVGYIALWIDDFKAQINSLVIIDDFRRKGYGYALIKDILIMLKNRSISEITLEVRPSNIYARKLYEKIGFKQVAIRKNYYKNGEDALMLYLELGSE
jgi:ribosomal-protein-alanine N-acetyltransferase